MKNATQAEWVKKQIASKGYISRNQCLGNYISRLSAIIYDLRHYEGYKLIGSWVKTTYGKDYRYTLVSKDNAQKSK